MKSTLTGSKLTGPTLANSILASTVLAGVLAVALSLAPVSTAQAQGLATSPVDSIVAVVDEDVILRSELDRAVANITTQSAARGAQLPPQDILEKQVLDRLILVRLQVARAADSGIRVSDAELQQAIAGVINQNRLTEAQLRERLAHDHIAYDEFRDNLRDELTVQNLRTRFVQSKVQISEGEIDQFLATQKVGGPEVRLANLQIAVAQDATPDQIAEAKKKIDDIKASIERGEIDFRSAAIRYSQAANALDGGEIGWRSYDAIPPAFVNMITTMQAGQITEPMRGSGGFQIVQVEEIRQPNGQKATQYRAQDILVRTSDVVGVEAARQKIEALRARIVAGEDFAKVAREASDDTLTKISGGDMGWFLVDQWGGSVANQIQRLADGEMSPVFQSDVGFHLIKRTGTREQDMTEENRRNKAREIIGNRKAEEEYERFLRELRSEAFVESRLGAAH
jgi:peptidyl-prolyl cis-trans isomerase SurA